jgi:hypothetical protein
VQLIIIKSFTNAIKKRGLPFPAGRVIDSLIWYRYGKRIARPPGLSARPPPQTIFGTIDLHSVLIRPAPDRIVNVKDKLIH